MANLKSLAKDTAIYGLSSIVGRFLNYLLVPLYTYYMPHDTGDYGISTNIYAYTDSGDIDIRHGDNAVPFCQR